MKILLSGAVVLALWMGAGTYWYTCQVKGLCDDSATNLALTDQIAPLLNAPPLSKKPALATWFVTEAGQTLFSFSGQPKLQKNATGISIPTGAIGLTDSLYGFLLKHPEKNVTVTGKYSAEEEYEGEYANLGEARAAQFRDMLVASGANPDRIEIFGEMNELAFVADGTFRGGIGIDVATMDEEVTKKVDEGIANRTLYTDFGKLKFQPDATLDNYAEELKAYLSKNPDVVIHITGHTDNVGAAAVNWKYGKWRASKVRKYFVQSGIEKARMTIDTEGMDAPVASNATEEGRALNRRIEVKIN